MPLNLSSLRVRRGDPIRPAITDLREAQKSMRLLPGRGILLTHTPSGVVVNARESSKGFIGSWYVSLSGAAATFEVGYVDGLEPLVNEVPMSGKDAEGEPVEGGVPRLELREEIFDDTGRSWLAIRAECDPVTGRIIAPEDGPPKLTMVQTAALVDPEDTVYLHAVAMLKRPAKAKAGMGTLHQIAYFDYQHRSVRRQERWEHFFCPA